MKRWAFALGVLLAAGAASACPLCNTETGAQVRALAFGPQFLGHLSETLAPVPILLALVAGIGVLDRTTATKERPDAE